MTITEFVHKVRRRLYRTEQEKAMVRWYADHGDETYRFSYDLGPQSLVVDAGGFEGQWASDMYSRYLCRIAVFEPVAALAAGIKARFARNSHIRVYDRGLGGRTRKEFINVSAHASSVFAPAARREDILIWDVEEWVKEEDIGRIDLLKINIEGGEYELLDRLFDMGKMAEIGNVQVQFHSFVPHAAQERDRIRARLSQTHTCTWNYPFVWENWELKK